MDNDAVIFGSAAKSCDSSPLLAEKSFNISHRTPSQHSHSQMEDDILDRIEMGPGVISYMFRD